jgi:hypothetical protein
MSMIAAFVVALSVGTHAHAQAQSYETLVEEAVTEYTRGNFQEARTLFALAHEKQPNARTFRGLGIVDYELRDYVTAIDNFEAALSDQRNKISKKQRIEVEHLLQRARRFVGNFTPKLEPLTAALRVDGREVALKDSKLTLNPGTYVVSARADGYAEESRKLTVRGGEDEALVFALVPPKVADAEAADAAPRPVVSSSPPASEPRAASVPPLPAIIAFTVGGVGLVTFAIAGSLGLAKEGELSKCSPSCPAAEIDTQETQLLVADIGLVVGIAGAGVGALLWALDGGEERAEPTARVEPWLAPKLAGARASLPF